MSRARDQVAREKARRDARLSAALAGGRSGLPAPMTSVRQRGGRGMSSAAAGTVNVPAVSSAEPGQGTPATITLRATGITVPAGGLSAVTFDTKVEDDARLNLFTFDGPASGLVLPWPGTHDVRIRRSWNLTSGFPRGGGPVAVALDGEVVWPVGDESTEAPTDDPAWDGFVFPEFADTVTVRAVSAGQVLSVLLGHGSGAAQTCDVTLEVSLKEPQGVGFVTAQASQFPPFNPDTEHIFAAGFSSSFWWRTLRRAGGGEVWTTTGTFSAVVLDGATFSDDGRLFVLTQDGNVNSVNLTTGALTSIASVAALSVQFSGALVWWQGTLLALGNDRRVSQIDPDTGTVLWFADGGTGNNPYGRLLVDDDGVFFFVASTASTFSSITYLNRGQVGESGIDTAGSFSGRFAQGLSRIDDVSAFVSSRGTVDTPEPREAFRISLVSGERADVNSWPLSIGSKDERWAGSLRTGLYYRNALVLDPVEGAIVDSSRPSSVGNTQVVNASQTRIYGLHSNEIVAADVDSGAQVMAVGRTFTSPHAIAVGDL